MVKTLKEKLVAFSSDWSLATLIFHLAMFLAAVVVFFVGLESLTSFLLSGRMKSYEGIWTLMVAAFLGGIFFKQFWAEKEEWQWKSVVTPAEHEVISLVWGGVDLVDHKIRAIPGWIGIGVFALVLMINADFQFSWNYLQPATGAAFMAWGAYALVVQAPWSAYLGYIAVKEQTKQSSFFNYVLEAKVIKSGEWERIQTSQAPFNFNGTKQKYQTLKASEKYSDIRVMEESGKRQVRITFE